MKYKNTLLFVIAVGILSGCSSMKVSSEHEADYAFSNIKTYQWIAGPADILDEDDTYTHESIEQALKNELSIKGWNQIEEEETSDVQVASYIKLKEYQEYASTDTREREFSGGFTFNQDSKSWGYEEREPDLEVYTVEEGTLTVLLFDTQTGERIWRGTLKTKIDRSSPVEKQQALFQKAAKKILTQLP